MWQRTAIKIGTTVLFTAVATATSSIVRWYANRKLPQDEPDRTRKYKPYYDYEVGDGETHEVPVTRRKGPE